MGMADNANKHIVNLATPLISVRRHGGAGAEATALLSYMPGETSGPLAGHTSAVPSRWEHRPGHAKSVRTRRPPPPPPPTTTVAKEAANPTQKPKVIAAAARAEEERLSDARSRDDVSCVAVNCSATGLSDAAAVAAAPGSRGSAMMDRFLPAAHAVAVASPLSTLRKAGSVRDPARPAATSKRASGGEGAILPTQGRLPLQHIPSNHLHLLSPQDKNEYDDDDAESDVHSTQGFESMKCGLLPTRCVKSTLLLLNPATAMRRSRGARRGEVSSSFSPHGGRSQGEMNPLLRRSRNGQQQPRHDPGTLSWEELYVKSLLRSTGGSLMGPAAAVASELDRTVRELYRSRGGGEVVVQPKASHLGLLLVLEDRSNEQCHGSSLRKNAADAGETTALLLPRAKSSTNAGKKLRRGPAENAGGYGFPLLLEDNKVAAPGREMLPSPLPLPLPKSPSESWLSRALPSVSNRPPSATSFLGRHVQSRKHAPLPLVLH